MPLSPSIIRQEQENLTQSPSRNELGEHSPVSDWRLCVYLCVCTITHTHCTNTCQSLSHILCSLIVFIRPASHSCLIGNTSPVGSLSTWWDYVCTFVYVCFCLWLCVPACVYFCLAPTTANSWERPADRCSRRGFVCLSLCLNIYFSCLVYFGGWSVFCLLVGGDGLISQTGNPAAFQQIFWWDRLFPRFPRKGRGCQIIVVIPLQLPGLTMIQCYWCISNTSSRFLVFATQDAFVYTTAKKYLLCSQQYGWQGHFTGHCSRDANSPNSSSKGEIWACAFTEMSVCLSHVLIIIFQAKSYTGTALSFNFSFFFPCSPSISDFIVSDAWSRNSLQKRCHPFCNTISPR